MIDMTQSDFVEPVYIWDYVRELTELGVVDQLVLDGKLVQHVPRNNYKTYDHILLPTKTKNIFTVIVVDLKRKDVFGHIVLDLNREYFCR